MPDTSVFFQENTAKNKEYCRNTIGKKSMCGKHIHYPAERNKNTGYKRYKCDLFTYLHIAIEQDPYTIAGIKFKQIWIGEHIEDRIRSYIIPYPYGNYKETSQNNGKYFFFGKKALLKQEDKNTSHK